MCYLKPEQAIYSFVHDIRKTATPPRMDDGQPA